MQARHFTWLPNTITGVRIVGGGVAMVYAIQGVWAVAFWLFAAALASDFLDGLAARKLHAATKLGELLDSLADGWLVSCGLIGLSAAGHLSWWVTGAAIATGVAVQAERRILRQKVRASATAKKMFAIVCLFVAWTFIILKMAALAYGWQWWYAALLVLVFAVAASLKRHRLRAWLAGHS